MTYCPPDPVCSHPPLIGIPARAFLVVVQLDVHAVMDLVVVQGDMVLVDRVPNSPHNEKKGD